MSGVSLKYNLSDIEKLQNKIAQLGKLDTADLMSSIGVEIESQTRRRLSDEKTAPDGSAWEALSDDWKERKRKGVKIGGVLVSSSGGILEFEGSLIDSITSESGSDYVEVGSGEPYAAAQQFGFEERNLPARPYLGLSDENMDDLAAVVNDFVDDHIKEAIAA